jgi:hypothetical protein
LPIWPFGPEQGGSLIRRIADSHEAKRRHFFHDVRQRDDLDDLAMEQRGRRSGRNDENCDQEQHRPASPRGDAGLSSPLPTIKLNSQYQAKPRSGEDRPRQGEAAKQRRLVPLTGIEHEAVWLSPSSQ